MDKELTVITQKEILGKDFKMYGTFEEPLFLAKDVADWIEYAFKDKQKGTRNISMMLQSVDEDEKAKYTADSNNLAPQVNTHGGHRTHTPTWFLTEDGLYEVLMLSRKPLAKSFKKQIKLILKSVRKTGGYLAPEIDWADPDNIQNLLDNWKKTKKELEASETRITRLIHDPDTTYTTTQLAKELQFTSAAKLNKDLNLKKILFRDMRGVWMLYSNYSDKDYMKLKQKEYLKNNGKEETNYYSVWTGKGRDFLLDLFSDKE